LKTRHDKIPRFMIPEMTCTRIKRSRLALEREREKTPLFSDQIAALQESPEARLLNLDDRVRKYDADLRQAFARAWKSGRRCLSAMSPEGARKCLNLWNNARTPATGEFFADHCHRFMRFADRDSLPDVESGKVDSQKGVLVHLGA
jgi:hypothetical protein